MSPTGIAASQLRQLVFYHLDNDMLDTAGFLAGRLHALEPRNPDAAHLFALTYLRQRRFKAAYDSAHKCGASGRHLGCAYVFAQACLQLGKSLEGATALEKAKSLCTGRSNWNKHSDTSRRHLPDTPAVQTLLGQLWQSHGDMRKAGDCFIEAHKANPFIWDAFEGLCKTDAELDVERMFRPPAEMQGGGKLAAASEACLEPPRAVPHPLASHSNFNQSNVFTPSNDPFNSSRAVSEQAEGGFVLPRVKGKSTLVAGARPLSEWDTPTANNGGSFDDDIAMGGIAVAEHIVTEPPPVAPVRRSRLNQAPAAPERPRTAAPRSHMASASDPHDSAYSTDAALQRAQGGHKRTISGHASQAQAPSSDPLAPPRRSNRLFGQGATTTKSSRSIAESVSSVGSRAERESRPARVATGAKGRTGTVGRVVSGNRKLMPPDPSEKERERTRRAPSRNGLQPSAPTTTATSTATTTQKQPAPPTIDSQAEIDAINSLLANFRQLAIGCYAANRYDLPQAIASLESLPTTQKDTPFVLAQLGKAYYEAADYRAAELHFTRLLKIQPSRIEDMEVYSTVLWHLKKDAPLAWLCHSLRDAHFDAPETWVAVGNSFSLSREHDHAIAAFKRATHIDPNFAYAWTLMGHEHIMNEDNDAALSAFRRSIAIDKRAYGGWYGLGRALEKQGKMESAERHYRVAATLNPSNATLQVCIGVIYEKLRKKDNALDCYTRALELAPQSALARFKKARVLMHKREWHDALEELEVLKGAAPDEANVWFLLGKCLKGLHDKGGALKAFTTALNLDVKASPFIKEAMEQLDEDEGEASDDD